MSLKNEQNQHSIYFLFPPLKPRSPKDNGESIILSVTSQTAIRSNFTFRESDEYLDLARTQLFVKVKIAKAKGTALDADTQVGPVNLFVHSLFSQVDVFLKERLISPSTNTYPYCAMIESLLDYGKEAKTSQLSMAMFYKDTPGKMDVANPVTQDNPANMGLKARYELTRESHIMDMMGPIHSDMLSTQADSQ